MSDKPLTGAAGVFYVASELSFRGMICLPTIRDTAGADIIVSNSEGTKFAHVQVKTASKKVGFWPLSPKTGEWIGDNCYYVFVRRTHGGFEAFMESAARVAKDAQQAEDKAQGRGCKKWALS